MEVFFDSPTGTIWYHPEEKIVHHKIKGNMEQTEFAHFLDAGLNLLKEKGAEKWLSEDQNSKAIPKEELANNIRDWLPKAIEAGWKYWAIVNSTNTISQISHEKISKVFAAMGIVTRYFDNPQDALQWLVNV